MILDFGSFTRKRLMVDHVSPTETMGGEEDKAQNEQRTEHQKEVAKRQKTPT